LGLGGGTNTYGYVGGNPLILIDSDGMNAFIGPMLGHKNYGTPGKIDIREGFTIGIIDVSNSLFTMGGNGTEDISLVTPQAGVGMQMCISPPPEDRSRSQCEKNEVEQIPMSFTFGSRYLGLTISESGTICIGIGLSKGATDVNLGVPIVSKPQK